VEEDVERKLANLTIQVLLIQVISMVETLKGYYDQHQATGCDCSLCKAAERAFRKINLNLTADIKLPAPQQVSRQLKALATALHALSRTAKKPRRGRQQHRQGKTKELGMSRPGKTARR
jgi:hypothetical protein